MVGTDQFNYLWQRWININPVDRPDRTTPEADKGEEYHRKCWRYYLGRTQSVYMDWFNVTAAINTAFANEQLWGLPEDKEMYLMDKGQTTTRRALRSPLIRPMVTRLVGQLSQVSIEARATAETQRARTRKEDAKKMAILMARAAQAGPEMAAAMQMNAGVGGNEEKAVQDAMESYQDMLIPAVNSLLTMSSKKNNLEGKRKKFGETLAVSGLCGAHASIVGNDIVWRTLEPEEMFWDTNANDPDMSDGEYMGCRPTMSVPDLCEQYQPKAEKIKALDQMTKQGSSDASMDRASWPNVEPRPYTVYWKDQRYAEWGFIQGLYGEELVMVNEPDPDTGEITYTEADLIDPPKNKFTKNWKGKTNKRCVTVIRYCTGIPYEYCPSGNGEAPGPDNPGDLILEWGMYPLQERDPSQVYSVKFPIKLSAWSYMSGYVVAPVTAAVSPQRVMNQVLSDITWRMSKAKLPVRILDKVSLTSGGSSIKQALFDMNQGDDIVVNATAIGGSQNAVTHLPGGLDNNFFAMFDLLDRLKLIAEASTGIYEQNYGAPGSANELVGVKQLQLQQASVMQQPYYDAIQRMYEQIHQFNAQAGRQFYIRHPWVLADMVGDMGLEAIMQSKDMELEQFRVGVQLALSSDQIKQATDALTMNMLAQQMLDPVSAAELLGQSYPEDVFNKARTVTKEMKEAAIQQAQQQAMGQQEALLMQQEMGLQQQEQDLYKNMLDASLKVDQINQKAGQPMVQSQADSVNPTLTQSTVQ